MELKNKKKSRNRWLWER